MNKWTELFPKKKAIMGMIHSQALPGTPRNSRNINEIIKVAVKEAILYEKCGLDALIIENMHDIPYLNSAVGPEITSSMTAIACAVKQSVSIPVGIQILAAANKEALAVALSANLQFIRAEGFVYGHLADEGYIDSCAGDLLRYRKHIGAEHIAIFTDIKKKHSSHQITSDVSIGETASAAEFFLSDGLIITGTSTGKEVLKSDLTDVRKASGLPILIGSGINAENIKAYLPLADGFIIGSYFKEQGVWSNPLSEQRIRSLIAQL
jgi:hypothetical protein